jgi:hypothetical protein
MNLRKIIREELMNESEDEWAWTAEIPILEKGRIYSVKTEDVEEFLITVESLYPEVSWVSNKKPTELIELLTMYKGGVYITLYLNNEMTFRASEQWSTIKTKTNYLTSHEPIEYKGHK